jgi:hypothetical protein
MAAKVSMPRGPALDAAGGAPPRQAPFIALRI